MPLNQLKLSGPVSHQYAAWPRELITGTGSNPRPRLSVDASQTSFWEGREFRLYHEFNIAAGLSVWLRFVTPVDVVLRGTDVTIAEGKLRLARSIGGTPSGTWTGKTVRPVNSMSGTPGYTTQMAGTTGGVVVGSTELDVMLLETPTSGQSMSVQATLAEEGRLAGTYYIELRNTGTAACRGIYNVRWEEMQPTSPVILGTA